LGIDASNIRAGGGISYLSQLLAAATPRDYGVERGIIWAGKATLERLPHPNWLEQAHEPLLDGALPQRAFWQQVNLPRRVQDTGSHILFTPGGTFLLCKPCTTVTIPHNLLPFERRESQRFGVSGRRIRYWFLRYMLEQSVLKADGVIFLTEYARRVVSTQLPRPLSHSVVIPYGVDGRFRLAPRPQKDLSSYSDRHPFRFLYVSIVNLYKHQWRVVEALGKLRAMGMPVAIDFVGPAYEPALRKLQRAIGLWDPKGLYTRYLGLVPFADLHRVYHEADAFVFASSCENLPNILLEAMSSGLPIACSNRGPMSEILGDAGVYFDPEKPDEIAEALRILLENPGLRERRAWSSYERAKIYSWERCARETFDFIAQLVSQ